jgi:hypothetical protein
MSSLTTDDPDILPAILEVSVRKNKLKDITGMMLYADGNVMQVLEGEKNVVLETFRAIQLDVRHRGIYVLIENEISTRNFASWSMGFRRLSETDLEKYSAAVNVFKVNQYEIGLRVKPGEALTVLKSFAKS